MSSSCPAQGESGDSSYKAIENLFGGIPAKFHEYDVILGPDKEEPEWWAAAPSVVRDANGTFWLAYRMRTTDSPRALRGYEIRLLRLSR